MLSHPGTNWEDLSHLGFPQCPSDGFLTLPYVSPIPVGIPSSPLPSWRSQSPAESR